ncbi:hypothetical protein KUTeg_013181 [Tegillarca granosa]|uniref:Methyltransferase FkbM domain-containing protein n=1 Tax=Tegillarca granosa TaxID=220873 RepID=A0ABQ9EXG0_TEGGR|nr:hypothetical protein KUTeg_013181 [Tegillarca granosa]
MSDYFESEASDTLTKLILPRKIDYVKFDIEYNEWAVLQAIFEEGSLESVKQLGFEIHINEKFNYRLNPFGEYKSKVTESLYLINR